MKDQTIIRDERTITVENTSYRWGYLLLSFGLLVVVAVLYGGRAVGICSPLWSSVALSQRCISGPIAYFHVIGYS